MGLDERIAGVMVDLAEVSNGASLCTISKSGGEVDGTKYQEGRMAALVELRRAANETDVPLPQLAAPIIETWRADLERQQDRGSARGWVAYRAGGVDELESLLEES